MSRFLSTLIASAVAASAESTVAQRDGIDFFLVQDVSYSYENDLQFLRTQIPEIITYLAESYHESSFGMSTFVDKPVGNFGYEISGDYCYDMTLPLTGISLNKDVDSDGNEVMVGTLADGKETELSSILDGLETYSGRDWPENQLGALLHTILSPSSGWNPERQPIIALATDSGYHQRGDGVDQGLGNTLRVYAQEPNAWCLDEDYPSTDEIKEALESSGARLLILVTPDMVNYYTNFLNEIGSEYGLVVGLKERSTYIAEAIKSGLEAIESDGSGFGSTASSKLMELLQQEQDQMEAENRLNRSAPEAPPSLIDTHSAVINSPKALRSPPSVVAPVSSVMTRTNVRSAPLAPAASASSETLESDIKSLQCGDDVTFEIVLIQDASESFENDRDSIAEQIPNAFTHIQDTYPGSRFGLTAFVDKPIEPFGYSSANDYCASMRVGLTQDVDHIKTSLNSLIIRSGNDWKEAQLHALMHTAFTRMANWSDLLEDEDGKRIVRVAALTTDAGYHEAGDSALPANNGDRYQDCEGEDYPSVGQVGDALRGQMIYPLFLVTDNVRHEYEHLLHRMHTNGAVRVMGDQDNMVASLEDSLISGLQSICNYLSVTPADDMKKSPALELNGDKELIELDINQRPKFLSIVSKK